MKLELIELPLRDTVNVFTASRMADVSSETIRRWCDEGRIPCIKLVGRWRIYRGAFLTWIESRRRYTSFDLFPPQPPQ